MTQMLTRFVPILAALPALVGCHYGGNGTVGHLEPSQVLEPATERQRATIDRSAWPVTRLTLPCRTVEACNDLVPDMTTTAAPNSPTMSTAVHHHPETTQFGIGLLEPIHALGNIVLIPVRAVTAAVSDDPPQNLPEESYVRTAPIDPVGQLPRKMSAQEEDGK